MTSSGSLLSQERSRISIITRSSASYQSRHTSSEPQSAAPRPGSRFHNASSTRSRPVHLPPMGGAPADRKSTRLNSSHGYISYAVFCLKKKNRPLKKETDQPLGRSDSCLQHLLHRLW